MRILLVSSLFPPQNAAGSIRTYGFARCWAEAGAEVTVLTTRKLPDQNGLDVPCAGFEIVSLPYRLPRLLAAIRTRGREPQHSPGPAKKQPSAWKRRLRSFHKNSGVFGANRMPDLTDFWVRPASRWAMSQPRWDAVVSSSGPYTNHLVAMRLRRAGRAALWAADFRDLWTANPAAGGLFPFTVIERALERRCLRHADLLTTVSEPLAKWLEYRALKTVHVIPNGGASALLEPLPDHSAFPEDGLVRLLYTGTVYPQAQSPEPLLCALAALRASRPDLGARLRLIVAGDRRGMWLSLATAHGAEEMFEHLGVVDRRCAWHMQRDADALVLLDWCDPSAGVLTSKIFEYLLAGPPGPPILAVGGSADSPVGALLRRTGRGVHGGNDPVLVADLIERIATDPSPWRRIVGDPLSDELRECTIEYQAARYLELLTRSRMPPAGR